MISYQWDIFFPCLLDYIVDSDFVAIS